MYPESLIFAKFAPIFLSETKKKQVFLSEIIFSLVLSHLQIVEVDIAELPVRLGDGLQPLLPVDHVLVLLVLQLREVTHQLEEGSMEYTYTVRKVFADFAVCDWWGYFKVT